MSSRASSRNSGARIIGAVGNGAGDMPASRKSSARTEFAQGSNASFSSSLEVLEPGDADDVSGRSSSRISLGSRSRSSLGQVPPRNDSSLSQRVTTPTKHVSLTAVRRKQEVETPIEPELDWREFTRSNSRLGLGGRSYSNSVYLTETAEETTADEAEVSQKMKAQASAKPSSRELPGEVTTQMEAMALHSTGQSQPQSQHKQQENSRGDREDHEEDDDDDDEDDDDDDDSDSDEEPRKAPNELLMEFLDCVMKKDFKTAEKLCRMILIYEPTNKEAVTFHPIILEKLQLEQEAAEAGEDGSGEEEEGDDDDDEDDSDEDSSLESDSSDDDDDDDEEEEDQADGEVHFFMIPEEDGPQRPDSGIGM